MAAITVGLRSAPRPDASQPIAVSSEHSAALQRVEVMQAQASERRRQGDSRAAANTLDDAAAILHGLRERTPFDPDVLRLLGINAYWLGQLSKDRDDLDGATIHWKNYLELSGQLSRLQPANVEWWIERSYALNNLGSLAVARSEWTRAAHAFAGSIALKRRALEARDGDAILMAALADSHSWLGMSREALGELDTAEAMYAQELALIARMRPQARDEPSWHHREARALWRRAILNQARGRDSAALADYQAAARGYDTITGAKRENRFWQVEQASVALRIEDILARTSQKGAVARLTPIHARMSRLQQLDSGKRGWSQIEAAARIRLSAALLREGRMEEARQHARAAASRLDSLLAGATGHAHLRVSTASALLLLADIDVALNDEIGARHSCGKARALLEPISNGSLDYRVLDPWVRANLCLGQQNAARAAATRLHAIGYVDGDYLQFLSNNKLKGRP